MKKMRKMQRILALVLAATLMISCGAAMADEVENKAFACYDEVVTVSIARPTIRQYDMHGISYDDNLWNDYMLENYNIDANIAWMVDDTSDAYNQKVSLAIASGDLPDVMIVNNLEQVMWMAEEGMLADLTPTYEEYAAPYVQAFFSSYGDRAFTTATYDGKILAVPDLVAGANHNMLWIRKDWLDKVGLEMPKTLAELKAALQAFVTNNVGGENTIGLSLNVDVAGNYGSIGNINPIFSAMDSFPRQWIRGQDGKYIYGTLTEETKNALAELHNWYELGILDKQFASRTNDDIKEMVLRSQCGAIYGPWWYGYELSNMLANDPTANWTCVSVPLNEKGEYKTLRQDAHRQWVVVRKGFEHPEVVWKFTSIYWQRGADARIEAIKEIEPYNAVDMHPIWRMPRDLNYEDCVVREAYEIIDAMKTGVTENLSIERKNFYDLSMKWINEKDPAAFPTYITRVVASSEAGNENIVMVDNAYPFPTETMTLAWADMESAEDQMLLKIIIGEEDISYFDEFVKQWMALGGDMIIEEVNEQLNK